MSGIRNENQNSDEDIDDVEYLRDLEQSTIGISSDSASTFEYVDNNLSPLSNGSNESEERDQFSPIEAIERDDDDTLMQRPLVRSTTKEEKQRHNEEIVVMESASASSESWESVPVQHRKDGIEHLKDNCKMFLSSERSFSCYDDMSSTLRPTTSAKACFIDASSLLDEEDLIYTPPPTANHKVYNAINHTQLHHNFASEDADDGTDVTGNVTSLNNFNKLDETSDVENDSPAKIVAYDIKDQYAVADRPTTTTGHRSMNSNGGTSGCGSIKEHEKHQGNLIFQHSIPQYSGYVMRHHHEDNYTSDMSLPSIYSSSSGGAGEMNDFGQYNSLCENTSDYNSGSANYSRLASDTDSIVLPDTPFNSIMQVARHLRICEIGDDIDGDESSGIEHSVSTPMKIPKRMMKHDESAPILSGGASIKDFTPKQCESPLVRRRTDACPIISGGSVDLEDVEVKKVKETPKPSTSFQSWIVDFNELRIEEKSETIVQQPKSLDYSTSSQKNGLGFYVDFNSLKTPEDEKPKSLQTTKSPAIRREVAKSVDEKRLKKSTGLGFYVDFSDSSRPDTPKEVKTPPVVQPKPNNSIGDKKNMFSMFIDLKEEKMETDNLNDSSATTSNVIPAKESKTEEITVNKESDKDKKGCYMFIESDSPVVKRRNIVSSIKNDAKRHSWNTNPPPESSSEAHRNAKPYQRSTSVTHEKGIMNILDKIPILSKTSSMSIDSSVSPYEDFSCSKSFSSYSNNSVTTSNSSIEQSGTRIPLDDPNAMTQSAKKRRKDAKLNETFDKSSQGSVTEGILSNEDSQSTDTDDVTFQNQEQDEPLLQEMHKDPFGDFKAKMETIPESSENSPFKKLSAKPEELEKETSADPDDETEIKIETHTMESLQALIEKQKQILETVTESTSSIAFVKLSDLDKPAHSMEYSSTMTNSAGARVSRLFNDGSSYYAGHRSLTTQYEQKNQPWTMSRSTGTNFANLASSVENSKSLSRLFPHLSKAFSSSVPSDVNYTSGHSPVDYTEFITSDYSYTSSVTSSRSGIDSADESSMSCRQSRRLGEDLLKMFLQEIATDVTLEVGNRKMRAHKCILRSRCQYFAAILAGNWVSNAGNVIQLPGYSYSAVHFALCHIYSGASQHPPEGISLMELASLSDLLGLEGLKELTAYTLKNNYCHNFHKPCSGCIDGILQVLPVTLNHGLDDLYRKCLKWVCKHFSRVWQTRSFAQLPSDVQQRCRQQIAAHLTSENVLNWVLDCENMLQALELCRWNSTNVDEVVRDVLDAAHCYIMDHFASLIASDSFLSLGHDQNHVISRLEHLLLRTSSSLIPEQACKSYPRAVRLNQLLTAKVLKMPNPLMSNENLKLVDRMDSISLRLEDEDMEWNEDFVRLVSALLSAIEQCLIRQCSRAMRCSAWQRMDADLRMKIQKLACLTEPEELRKLRSSVSSMGSVRNYSVSSSVSSRTNDLRQVKLVIQAHTRKIQCPDSNIPVIRRQIDRPTSHNVARSGGHQITKSTTQTHVPDKNSRPTHKRSQSEDMTGTVQEANSKFSSVKPRYMEPRKSRSETAEAKATNRLQVKVKNMSSSESSTRGSSPAFNRKRSIGVKKASNLSLDSLQSPAKTKNTILTKTKVGNVDLSMDSLVDSMRSSLRTEKTISQESLLKGKRLLDEHKLKKGDAMVKCKIEDSNRLKSDPKQNFTHNTQIRRSFLSQKSREILAKRSQDDRKLSTNSNSSIATKSTKSLSPRLSEINKSSSSASVSIAQRKKVFSTTLHLRKTANIAAPAVPAKLGIKNGSKLVGSSSTSNVLKHKTETTKKISSVKSSTKPVKKILHPQKAPIAKEEEFESKMARSNTFSKETSDNPIELLKIIN